MNNPFILFEISKYNADAHRIFVKVSKAYRHLMRTTEMKYHLMNAWIEVQVLPLAEHSFYTAENGQVVLHGCSRVYKDVTKKEIIYEEWRRDGMLHRDDDKYAVFYWNLRKGGEWKQFEWYKDGKLHRDKDDFPAIVYSNGDGEWWRHGLRFYPPPNTDKYYFAHLLPTK